MNTTQSRRQQRPAPVTSAAPAVEQDFDQLAEAAKIEHLTVPGFLRRVSNRWHMEDITRFGDKVGRAAEAMQLSYMTTVDRSLGVIRVFPVPLLQRIYQIMSVQFGWPQIVEAEVPALDDPRRVQEETLRSHERIMKHLQALLSAAVDDIDLQASLAVVLQWLDHDCQSIREALGLQENSTSRG
ncbi:MAG: hypothetical protein WCF18_08985 [Chthoniobacteraceae bacterium]